MSFTASSIGGEYDHKLTAKELPLHEHALYYTWGDASENSESHWQIPMQNNYKYEIGTWPNNWTWNDSPISCGDEPHNNIQPYITVHFWRRIN